jgi:glycosyltransferase involved in cell wall biosynthesis
MRIALINTYADNGGAAVACLRLTQALRTQQQAATMVVAQQNAAHPHVVATAVHQPQKLGYYAAFAAERLDFLRYEKSKNIRFAYSPANFGTDIRRVPAVADADVLHFHWINHGFLSLNFIEKIAALHKPVVFTLHDQWLFTGGCHYSNECTHYEKQCGNCTEFLKKPHATDLSHRIYLRKKEIIPKIKNLKVVTCSPWLAKLAQNSGILQGVDVQAISNCIDTQVYAPLPAAAARQMLGLPDAGVPLVLFAAGNVADSRKGFEYLIQALQHLKNKNTAAELLIFGKCPPEILNHLPLKTHYLGKLTDENKIIQAYNAASVYVTPSLQDNLPNTIVEALACGVPVAAFDTGGIPQMVEQAQTGYIVPQKNSVLLASAIEFCIKNQNTMRPAARNFALKNYAYDRIAQEYMAVYDGFF